VINGIWLFAGEGALLQRKPLPLMRIVINIEKNSFEIPDFFSYIAISWLYLQIERN
jgi:hypothetical protein